MGVETFVEAVAEAVFVFEVVFDAEPDMDD